MNHLHNINDYKLHPREVGILEALEGAGGTMQLREVIAHILGADYRSIPNGKEQAAAFYGIARRLRDHGLVCWEPPDNPPHDLKRETVISITEDGRMALAAHDQPGDS